MPEYLRFMKGVIDTEDIPLNISREVIQNNIKIDKIKKHVLKKIFDHLNDLKKKDWEKYLKIWDNFMRNFKEGITNDFENKDKIASLLLFNSSVKDKNELIDLKTYMDSMQKDQNEIYYITGMDLESLEKNPALEIFKKKKINVLYLTDPIDEIVIDHLREYNGKKFKIVSSADLKLDNDDKKDENKDLQKDADNFAGYLKTIYGDRIADVKVSERLIDSPCILVNQSEGPSVQMEKMMKMINKDYSYAKRVFEINKDNELIKELIRIHKKDPASNELKLLSNQLLDNMMLREGVIDNIDTVIPQIQDIMLKASKNIK
jgi:molecular chaperone HtpG